jgi:polysaccharide export outer membrane protein
MLKKFAVCLTASCVLFGCSSRSLNDHDASTVIAQTGNSTPAPAFAPEPTGVNYFGSSNDTQRLQAIWQARTQAKPFSDFPIGPGDQISIIVPAVNELSESLVRVSAAGDIYLPLLGHIHAAGMTEAQLRDELKHRLKKYMYDPQFQLFVREYLSRQVAVVGAVARPGVFTLRGPDETVLELISQAGGPTDPASDRVVLIPATASTRPTPESMEAMAVMLQQQQTQGAGQPTSASPEEGGMRQVSLPASQSSSKLPDLKFLGLNGQPVVMALRSNSMAGSARYLNLPLRPGDVVVVPSGGNVAVIGWVVKPGSFKATLGLSLMSAIGTAGGPMWAADQNDVHLFRTAKDGSIEVLRFDLDKIRRRQQADIPVQGNDVIEMSYSSARVVPYVFYKILDTKVGGVGFAVPVD